MDFLKAKQEFQVRYYLWAISEWEKEINESLPKLRSFKSGSIWKTYQFMRLLNKHEQMALARGLLKRFHPDAVEILGESCSPEEETLRRKRGGFFDIRQKYQFVQQLKNEGQLEVAEFWLQQLRGDAVNVPGIAFFHNDESLLSQLDGVFQTIGSTFEEQIAAKRKAGEKMKFVSKRKLQKVITEKFQAAFGDKCVGHDYDDICDPHSHFDIECCGWILRTNFWFGRLRNLLEYNHSTSSPTKIHHPQHPGTQAVHLPIAICISFSSWLGITSQNQWEYILNEDVNSVCDTAIQYCRHFFEVAPKLLKGLEFENIAAD